MKSYMLWAIILVAMGGFIVGFGGHTFVRGQGLSYFSDDPKACVNCHVMTDQYQSWSRSSHREFTTCNTCHLPENGFAKAFSKGENALNHSVKFTTGWYNEPIQIRKHNFDIAMQACLNCHGELFEDTTHFRGMKNKEIKDGYSCLECHDNVGHPH